MTPSVTCVIALVKVHIYICFGTVPELPCSGPWYRTYCQIFWRLGSKGPIAFSFAGWFFAVIVCQSKKDSVCCSHCCQKVILKLWLDPSTPVRLTWMSYLLDIARLECTTAKIHGATRKTIQFWLDLIDTVSDLLKSWVYYFLFYFIYIYIYFFFFYMGRSRLYCNKL